MADDGKSPLVTASDIGEAIIKPVVDEVGKALEEGVQSVVGSLGQGQKNAPDPVQRQIEEQKKKEQALRVIEWYKQIDEAQRKVREQKQQELLGKKAEEDEKKKVKQFQVVEKQQKKQDLSVAQLAERKAEIKRGVGG